MKTIKQWKKVIPNFQTDLARGRIGELAAIHASHKTLEPLDGREGDMKLAGTRTKIEFKADSYDINKTPNLFIEKYRSGNKPGGPYQAREHGCKYYAYCFVQSGDLFLFNVNDLCDRMDLLHDSKNLVLTDVQNPNYVTRGLKIHRDWVTDLMLNPKDVGFQFDTKEFLWYINYNKAVP